MLCQNCGRKLKDEKSIELGYGPACYKRLFPAKKIRTKRSLIREERASKIESDQCEGQFSFADYPGIMPDQINK